MIIKLKGRVIRSSEPKNGKCYVDFLDTESGGIFNVGLPVSEAPKIDTLLAVTAEVRAGKAEKNGQYFQVIKLVPDDK